MKDKKDCERVNFNKETMSIVAMDLEEYLDQYGLRSPVSDFLVDKTKGNRQLKTQQGADKFYKEAESAREEYHEKRNEAINEYKELIEAGKIRPKTPIEKAMTKAHGHEDNQSTHASRRMLAKRGVSWKTGNTISKDLQDMARDLHVEIVIGEIFCAELGEQLSDLNEKITEYFDEIGESPAISMSIHTSNDSELNHHLIDSDSLLDQYKNSSINVLKALKSSVGNEQIAQTIDRLESQISNTSTLDIDTLSPRLAI